MKHSEAVDRENQKALMRKGMSEKDAVVHSMKNKKSKSKKDGGAMAVQSREDYPYGLRIHVDGEQAKKLGVHKAKAGHKVKLKAHAKVVSVSHDHRDGEKPSSRMELQITHMGMHHGDIEKGEKPDNEAAEGESYMHDNMSDPDGEDQD